jgi:hypothetical protein
MTQLAPARQFQTPVGRVRTHHIQPTAVSDSIQSAQLHKDGNDASPQNSSKPNFNDSIDTEITQLTRRFGASLTITSPRPNVKLLELNWASSDPDWQKYREDFPEGLPLCFELPLDDYIGSCRFSIGACRLSSTARRVLIHSLSSYIQRISELKTTPSTSVDGLVSPVKSAGVLVQSLRFFDRHVIEWLSFGAALEKKELVKDIAAEPPPNPKESDNTVEKTNTAKVVEGNAPEWTIADHGLFERALRKFPNDGSLPGSDRWVAIAAEIPGKTFKQCIRHYKEVRERLQQTDFKLAAGGKANTAESSVDKTAPSLIPKQLEKKSAPKIAPQDVASVNSSLLEREYNVSKSLRQSLAPHQQSHIQTFEHSNIPTANDLNLSAFDLEILERHQERVRMVQLEKEAANEPSIWDIDESAKSDSECGSELEEEEEGEEKEPDWNSSSHVIIDPNTAHAGIRVTITGLLLSGVAVIKSKLLRLQMRCARCNGEYDAETKQEETLSGDECRVCHMPIQLRLRALIAHGSSAHLGYLDLEHCAVRDMLPSEFWVTCGECVAEMPKELIPGKVASWPCHSCHEMMSVRLGGATFERVVPGAPREQSIPPRNRKKSRRERKDEHGFKIGTPLPHKGACSHYKRSFLWRRCPICFKAFPCERCHDAVSDHPMAWASRLICGACSREQSATNKACSCGQSFVSVAKSHWEGGSGCRDKTKMSRNDPKRYAGLNKTVSRRAIKLQSMKKKR